MKYIKALAFSCMFLAPILSAMEPDSSPSATPAQPPPAAPSATALAIASDHDLRDLLSTLRADYDQLEKRVQDSNGRLIIIVDGKTMHLREALVRLNDRISYLERDRTEQHNKIEILERDRTEQRVAALDQLDSAKQDLVASHTRNGRIALGLCIAAGLALPVMKWWGVKCPWITWKTSIAGASCAGFLGELIHIHQRNTARSYRNLPLNLAHADSYLRNRSITATNYVTKCYREYYRPARPTQYSII